MTDSTTGSTADTATDLLLSLPAMESIPKIFETANRSELVLRQCETMVQQEIPKDSPLAGLADHLGTLIAKHQEERYRPKGESVRYRYSITEPHQTNTELCLRTYVGRIDSHNGTSTYVSEVYTIQPIPTAEPSSVAAVVSGVWTLHTFYGEEGHGGEVVNVQTQLHRRFTERTIQAYLASEEEQCVVNEEQMDSDDSSELLLLSLARAIVEAIVQFVDDQQLRQSDETAATTATNNLFEQAKTDLHQIRRVLPITKTRFPWDSLSAQRNMQSLFHARQQQKQQQDEIQKKR